MHKFFVPPENFEGNQAVITGDDVKHIYKVLRLTKGEKISINNLNGKEFIGEIADVTKEKVTVKILEQQEVYSESSIDIHLYQGMPKASKMDGIVQKGTELGVNRIIPLWTKRVISRREEASKSKADRWRKIAIEACKQCKRSKIPEIEQGIDMKELYLRLKSYDLIMVPYENSENYGIKAVKEKLKDKEIKNIAIIIGPEGGFEEDEIEKLKALGGEIVTLGKRILRTETAGIITSAVIQYEFGDLGGTV
ncbi:MAG: 16S rRNA (uracil(1498)-N(3))-methyltransferase [Bacillota bacterium]|nr:16S rRNA (uracil(1498)-N(3))-methyltransferase [Bacillota bacterium]